ncbi:cell division protein FtsA [Pediococcus damnosus]|uniref:cell division protein FtsA n=1 Tax=Pediococcus damnosus TaxID=51663 RepID=UPI000C1CBFE5|nr:cell division protein FtsA [Pediococcus damnosus]PIO86081.1 cell division protein FtsA [Pediococcus damnosus]
MDNSGIYVGLDIGTTSIKVIVAEYVNGQMSVIGVGSERSDGMNRGVIVDIDKASAAIKRAISVAENKANLKIHEVVAGIPANLLKIEPCRGMIAIAETSREITNEDVVNVANAASVHSLPPEQEVIDVLPDEFVVDGFDGIKDPRGMVGVRLEMNGTVLTGPKTIIHNTKRAIQQAGLHLTDLVLNPLALGRTVLNDGEQDFGTILIDMGAGQTTTSIIHDHHLKYTYVDQEGGQFVTKDISVVLNTSLSNAEKLKREYGYAFAEGTSDDAFPVEVVGQSAPSQVTEKYLAEIIEARLEQILNNAYNHLENIDALNMPGGVVITGGAAAIPGIQSLAADIFNTNVKIYVPEPMGLRHPAFAQAFALLNYEASLSEVDFLAKSAMVAGTKSVPEQQTFDDSTDTDEETETEPNTQTTPRRAKKTKPQKESSFSFSGMVASIKRWFSEFFD